VHRHSVPFDADVLPDREIAAFKELERTGRDAGAASYLERLRARGRFRLRAEDLTLYRHVAPHPEEHVLDAGCGVGRHALVFAARVRRITGVDFSEKALRVLRREAERRQLRNVDVQVADVCDLPDDLGPFDTVFSSEVLQHVPSVAERLKAMRGFHRVLRPGGRCVVNVLCRHVRQAKDGLWSDDGGYCHYFTPADLRGLFEEAGFTRVSIHGSLITPGGLTRHLPSPLAYLEAGLSSWGFLAGMGHFVIGVGEA
jgi:2-polyprenyl-3-methyl-5-hydroxy-6-metoxy-1,4-benzoquinol methylase